MIKTLRNNGSKISPPQYNQRQWICSLWGQGFRPVSFSWCLPHHCFPHLCRSCSVWGFHSTRIHLCNEGFYSLQIVITSLSLLVWTDCSYWQCDHNIPSITWGRVFLNFLIKFFILKSQKCTNITIIKRVRPTLVTAARWTSLWMKLLPITLFQTGLLTPWH